MQGIQFQIINDSEDAVGSLEKLEKALENLKAKISGATSGLSRTGKGIASIKTAVSGLDTSKLDSLAASLEVLGTKTGSLKISSSIGNQLDSIASAVTALPTETKTKITELSEALGSLSSLGKQNLGSYITQLNKLPEMMEKLKDLDLSKLKQQMEGIAEAMQPLANEMSKISSGFSALPSRIQKLITSTESYNSTVEKATKKTNAWSSALKTLSIGAIFQKVVKLMASSLSTASNYTEVLNTFTVSLSEYAQEAYEYAQTVSEVMGIDPSTWMENQGIFNSIITGFGVASDKAAVMSKNLTQLAYDLSSFYNIGVEEAMQKVQSGISGELEPLRRLGYDLSTARLQQEAYNLGIEKSVSAMTQAEKAQLRYHAMLTQVTQVQGDMARTLQEPANQLRVLQAQVTQCARAFGNIFIPILNNVLPIAIAVASALREVISAIASLFGVEIADSVDWGSSLSDASAATGDISDDLSDAADSAEEMKRFLMGIDELNVIPDQSSSSSSGSGSSGSGSGFDIDPIDYDFLGDAVTENIDKIKAKLEPFVTWIKENLEEIISTIATIGAMFTIAKLWKTIKTYWNKFLGLKIVNTFLQGFDTIYSAGEGVWAAIKSGIDGVRDSLTDTQKAAIVAVAAVLEFAVIENSVKNLVSGCENVAWQVTKIGLAATAAGAAMYVALGPSGVALAAIVALAAAVVGVTDAQAEMMDYLVDEAFYSTAGVKISELSDTYGNLMQSIIDTNQPIVENQERISSLRESIAETSESVGLIARALTIGTANATDEIENLKELFNSLKDDTSSAMNEIYDNIVTAIGGSFGQALIAAGESIPEIMEFLNQIRGEGTNTLSELQAELDNLNQKLASGEISGAEFQAELLKIEERINSLIGVASDTEDVFNDLSNTIGSIDWEDSAAVSDFFESITETTAEAKTSINDTADAIIDSLNTMKNWTTDEGLKGKIDSWIEIAEADRNSQLASVDAQLTMLYDSIQADLVKKTQTVQTAASEAWQDMNWLEQAFSGAANEASYANQAISNYQSNIVQPISEQIQSSMEELGVDGSTWASDAIDKVTEALFTFNGTRYGSIIYEYQSTLEESISQVFTELQQSGKVFAIDSGTEIIQGMAQGVTENTTAFEDSMTAAVDAGETALRAAADINSPSKLFAIDGGYMMDGLIQGVNDKTPDLQSTFSNIISVTFDFNVGYSYGYSYGQSLGNGIADGIRSIVFPMITASISALSTQYSLSVQAYASGGFPTEGQLFIAREAGAEMVGSIGNRTAVANNDQIVSAVSQGVSDANDDVVTAIYAVAQQIIQQMREQEQSGGSANINKLVAQAQRRNSRVYGG